MDPPQRHKRFGNNILIAVAASGSVLILELWASWVTGSLALLSDAGHLFVDISGLLLAYMALRWAARPATPRATYGFYRAEVLAAAANGFLLLGVVLFIVGRAIERLNSPLEHLDTNIVLPVAIIGLLANLVAAKFLQTDAKDSINTRGAFLNVMGDALASLGVIASALLVRFTGDPIYDTLVSFVVAAIIGVAAVGLIRDTSSILLERTPSHIMADDVKRAVESVPGVVNVHDLHVWTLTPGRHSASLHATIATSHLTEFWEVTAAMEAMLAERFGLDHCTIQVEPEGHDEVSDRFDPVSQRLEDEEEGSKEGKEGGDPTFRTKL